MRRLLLLMGLLVFSSFAYNQTAVCEAQCQGWKFVWQDDFAFDYLKTMCAKDPVYVGIDMVGFWADMATKSIGLQTYMEAFLCYEMVDMYLEPQILACKATCAQNDIAYAPNLHLDDEGVYYSESRKTIQVRIRNNGRAYMPESTATVYVGESDSAVRPTQWRLIKTVSVPGLRPHDVRFIPEGMDQDELMFTYMPFTPAPDKYTVVFVNVSSDPRYRELTMADNSYDLIINDLPSPARLFIDSATFSRYEDTTDTFTVDVTVGNDGELPANAEVRYYLGHPPRGGLAASEQVRVPGEGTDDSEQVVSFAPGNSTILVVQLVQDGAVIQERTLYPRPAFFFIEGKVKDETGRPIEGARITVDGFSDTAYLSMSSRQYAVCDETGHYEFSLPLREEKSVRASAAMDGYFPNSTTVILAYNDSSKTWITDRRVRVDFTLEQQPVEVNVGYPAPGKYIIETDKGRFTGDYTPGVGLPVRGANGTIFIASENCSFFAGKFNTSYGPGYLEFRPNVTCLNADSNDDYAPIEKETLLWEKEYSGEEPRMAVFDRRGDHAYVLTASTTTNFCNVYAYDLQSGNQQFRFNTSSICNKITKISPAYDGSQVYIGVGAQKTAKTGETQARGYLLGRTGEILYQWDFEESSGSLQFSSAGSMAELALGPLNFYAPGGIILKQCNLIAHRSCGSSTKAANIESLGISRNRALATCNSTSCMLTPAHEDIVMLDRHYTNGIASGSYANEDVFVADHKGGSYYHGGDAVWGTSKNVEWVSMSPGGSYVALAYDPYGIGIFSPAGNGLMNSSAHATGLEATERGIVYATHQGNKISFYRMSTFVQPGSSTTTGGGELNTNFVAMLFQALVDFLNGIVQALAGLFG